MRFGFFRTFFDTFKILKGAFRIHFIYDKFSAFFVSMIANIKN